MSITIKSPSGREIKFSTGLFINNEFRPSKSNNVLTTPNPATGEDLATVSAATAEDVDDAVQAARRAFVTTWGKKSTPSQRSAALHKWADLIQENIDTLAELESLDNGKPVWMARDIDIVDSIDCLRYYAGLADKIEGRTIEQEEGRKIAFTRPEPIGVCGQIIPWNYPIQMFAWKVGAALAAGNTIIMKPAEQTPLSALVLAELSIKAGFPPGVINIVNGLGSVAGRAISSHMDIDKIAFTGSTITGRSIMESAAKSNLKKVTLELGGKSPVVVFENADIDQAVNWVSQGILFNHGQDCCAGSRLFLQESIKEEFLSKLKKNFESHVIGDPFDIKTYQGPQVSKQQQEKILSYIKSGIEQGATLLTGGEARIAHLSSKFKNGFYTPPTIFTDCKPGMKIVDEEIFGPVLTVQTFETEEEAIEKANNTPYGLGAGVFSQNASQCMRMVHALCAGTVWCNQYVALSNAVPFGGMKQSGFGRELGIEGLKEYTQTKSVHWNYGEKADWPVDGTSN
ncbi:aldehyde dehydrogenase [Yamadazyma tenuis]|uniref:Aldehyde dehydrogenase n=1 Tax=Candida tenuis (strain ATCC 10573 / BCRC 21748 / CBS 615 / JCM 9827 / NBRC 10315 / NRRL Y-1498 / VKM Y-70) TaxID=590646 RepID=G3AXA0_CANTC|nr:aldehyde dehydrogenase [Yamadazyma tenuis ATCC 10573]EGV66728.1 aldehyde dehydrogenase [Yamadazyma tenuis ATCC 10573]WEJ95136.1 aldehyde dehydrogenase [Yamadazyma tenuis]